MSDRQEVYPSVTSLDLEKWLSEALELGKIEIPDTEKCGSLMYFSTFHNTKGCSSLIQPR